MSELRALFALAPLRAVFFGGQKGKVIVRAMVGV